MFLTTLLADNVQDVIGTITPPAGVAAYDAKAGGGIGLIVFASNLIKIGTVIAGLWVLMNFILAGYTYITSNGDTGAHKKVTDSLTMSVIGLVLIVVSYTAIGVISLLIFGKADYILNPQICGPNGC